MRVLLTGVTGYVGGRLLLVLARRGLRLRCMARRPERLRDRVPQDVEVVQGDVLDPASLTDAMAGIDTAFYLIHSMGVGSEFEALDRQAATNFGEAARAAGVRRIVYLGGLGDEEDELSAHLSSRHEVGDLLRASGVPVVEFRASIVIGSGSLSFEMVRALVERLPVMVTPRWVKVEAQPIFIGDVLAYLAAAVDIEADRSRTFEIGGPDVVSYGDLMREYARQRGLRRWMVPVPVLTPRLSSLWLGLVTPLYARVGRSLIDSMRHPTIVRDRSARTAFAAIVPVGVPESIAQALRNEDETFAHTRWSDAESSMAAPPGWGGTRFGNRLVDLRVAQSSAPPGAAFAAAERIGGATGWYYGQWLWRMRGWMDLLIGGVGMRRGRRDPARLSVGDVVDCWRVEAIEPGRRLLLAAEMKLPGRAWLEFDVRQRETGQGSEIRQTAMFDPLGLAGHMYWYAVWPLHQFIFGGMLRNLAAAAERGTAHDPRARD